jgi:hypothetical protein
MELDQFRRSRARGQPTLGSGQPSPTAGRAVAGGPLLLLEHLAIRCHLLRVENCFDLLVGAIPDCAHLGRLRSQPGAAVSTACTIWSSATTPASAAATPASSAAPATTLPSTSSPLTARSFSEGLDIHYFVREDRANSALLRGIQI